MKGISVIGLKAENIGLQSYIVILEQENRSLIARLQSGNISLSYVDKVRIYIRNFFKKFYFLFKRK